MYDNIFFCFVSQKLIVCWEPFVQSVGWLLRSCCRHCERNVAETNNHQLATVNMVLYAAIVIVIAAYGLLHCTYDYVTLVWRWDARWNWLPASHPKWILFIHTLLRAMKITCYKRCEQRCKYSTRHVTLVLWVTNDWRHSKIRFLFLGNYSSLRAAQGWISVLLFSAVCSGRDIVAVGLSGSSERCVGNQKRLLTVMFLFCLPLCWTRKQIVSTSVGRNIFTGCLAYEFSIFLYFMFVTQEYLFLKAESLCQFHGAHEWLRLRIEAKGTLMYFIHQ